MNIPEEEYLFYVGERFQVEFYFTDTGQMPAKEYFEKADNSVRAKLATQIKRIAEEGRLYDKTHYNLEDRENKIWAFKPHRDRFFNFFTDDKRIIITNAYRKQKQKVSKKDLEKAISLKRDYLKRKKAGEYYV